MRRATDNAILLTEIKQFYEGSQGICGGPRIYRDCKAAGLVCSDIRIAKLMRNDKLHAVRGYRKSRYKSSKPATAAPNRLRQVFVAQQADEV